MPGGSFAEFEDDHRPRSFAEWLENPNYRSVCWLFLVCSAITLLLINYDVAHGLWKVLIIMCWSVAFWLWFNATYQRFYPAAAHWAYGVLWRMKGRPASPEESRNGAAAADATYGMNHGWGGWPPAGTGQRPERRSILERMESGRQTYGLLCWLVCFFTAVSVSLTVFNMGGGWTETVLLMFQAIILIAWVEVSLMLLFAKAARWAYGRLLELSRRLDAAEARRAQAVTPVTTLATEHQWNGWHQNGAGIPPVTRRSADQDRLADD